MARLVQCILNMTTHNVLSSAGIATTSTDDNGDTVVRYALTLCGSAVEVVHHPGEPRCLVIDRAIEAHDLEDWETLPVTLGILPPG